MGGAMVATGKDQIRIETREAAPGIQEVRIEGSLDWSNFTKVEAILNDIFEKGVYKVVVNLRGTTYISSAGFGCFISSLDTAMKNNGNLVFTATPPEIQDVFNILGLSKILTFAETEEAALKLLGA